MSILQFPSTFFEPEVREGFYISGMMKRAWAVQLETLALIAQICKKYDIKWFADCGTLIGAVRHGGYIPWDDDLDICMLRDDFEKFRQVVDAEIPEEYENLDLFYTDDVFQPHMRIVKGHEIQFDNAFLANNFQFPYLAGVDIFPLDYVSEDKEAEQMRKELIRLTNDASLLLPDGVEMTLDQESMLEQIEESCQVKFDRNKSIKRQLYAVEDALYAMFPSEGAKHVVFMKYWIENSDHLFPIELFDQTIQLPFEQMMVNAPAKYDAVLRIEYGDYTRSVRGGGVHDYPFYWKMEKKFKLFLGARNPFDYAFQKEYLDNEVRKLWEQYLELIRNFVTQMEQNLGKIEALYQAETLDAIFPIFEACQNDAIALGTKIEQSRGEGHDSVRKLEAFCEHIFACYQSLANGSSATFDLTELRKDMMGLDKSVSCEKREKKEMVFLPFAAKHWKAMESMWKKAKEDPDLDVYVVPIPYLDKSLAGQAMGMHYNPQEYPTYVEITDYREYDFVRRHPDVIVTQNPYDEYGDTISVHPDFYTRKLRQYTEKIVYVPYFIIDELTPEDEKGKHSLKYFVPVPGVMLADEIIVQSEQMKQAYVQKLVEHAGEETRAHWEEIIKGTGLPLAEYVPSDEERFRDIPAEWKNILFDANGTVKKIMLYTVSTSCIMEHGEQAIRKMRSVFDVFYENKDKVACVWRPHPQMEMLLGESNSQLRADYKALVDYFKEKQFGIIDSLPSVDIAIKLADAYYGDGGSVMQKCVRKKIPIMVQNYEIM